jgi:hypothetical protein
VTPDKKDAPPVFPIDDVFTEPLSVAAQRRAPVIKGVYEPTGSGKTFASIRMAADALRSTHPAVPIYIAPIRRLVDDFAAEVTAVLKGGDNDIPIYRLYARADFENNEAILDEIGPFCATAKKHLVSASSRAEGAGNEAEVDTQGSKSPADWLAIIERAVKQYRGSREWARASPGDSQAVEQMAEAMERIWRGLRWISQQLVKRELLQDYRLALFDNVHLRPMLLRLSPLDLFEKRPGLIIATASKFASGARQARLKTNKLGVRRVEFQAYDTYFEWVRDRQERFLLLIDEEEESYSFLFRALKKDLTNRDVDLHRVVYAFFHHFDVAGLAAYADEEGDAFARKLFDVTAELTSQLADVRDAIDGALDAREQVERLRQVACLSSFRSQELRLLVDDFFGKNDIQNGFAKLRQKLEILEAIKNFIKEEHRPWPDATRSSGESPFDVYRRLVSVFHDKKHILAARATIREVGGELEYLFFNERLEVFEHEILRQVRVAPAIANRNLELVTADALLEQNIARQRNSFSLGEFLRFVMLMTRILLRAPIEAPNESRYSRITDHQANVLHRYRRKVGNWGINKAELPLITKAAPEETLTEETVFRRSKFALSIVEDPGPRGEYADDLRVMTIAATVLRRTPEDALATFLRAPSELGEAATAPGNVAYLMSATGGMGGCWGSYNLSYLEARLGVANGSVMRSEPSEFMFMREFRHHRASKRSLSVVNFDRNDFIARVGAGEIYSNIERELMLEAQAPDLRGAIERNPYKLDELRYLCALLARLAAGSDRSAMAFTQTVANFKSALDALARRGMGVRADEYTRGLYIVDPRAFGGSGQPIRVIAYTAGFGKDEARLIEGQFREFGEADGIDEDADESRLDALLDERAHKVLLLTSFRSAARGLNLTLKCETVPLREQGSVKAARKDFDVLLIAMSPYYDGLYRAPNDALIHMEKLQGMLQHLYLTNRLPQYQYRDLPRVIADNREEAFRPEYFRKIGREIIQTIGRIERVSGRPSEQTLLLNREVVLELAQFYKLEPDFSDRLSAANHAVFRHTQAFVEQTRMFASDEEWTRYVREEIARADAFLRASASIYRGFRNAAKRGAWQRIRSPLMFSDPGAFIRELDSAPDGLALGHWRAFVDYSFTPRAQGMTHIVTIGDAVSDVGRDENLSRALEAARSGLEGAPLYADLLRGQIKFDPTERLVPKGLRATPEFAAAVSAYGINVDAMFDQWLPRPQFFTDYVKGYFAELIFIHFAARLSGWSLIDAGAHERASELFERFDVFLEGPENVLAIDVKNWSRRSDRLLGRGLRQQAPRKTQIAESALRIPIESQRKAVLGSRAVEECLNKPVLPVYLNLCGERSGARETLDGKSVRFFNLFVPEPGADGWMRYVVNRDFVSFLATASVRREHV